MMLVSLLKRGGLGLRLVLHGDANAVNWADDYSRICALVDEAESGRSAA
jgi:hypothetical protein